MSYNQITWLPPSAFAGAGALASLCVHTPRHTSSCHICRYLLNNALTWIDGAAFHGLPALQTLDLSANQLTGMATGVFAQLSALVTLCVS